MAFRDQLIRCGACGSEFVYTVREQRKRAEMGLPTDPPAFCPDCRGADVRLADAATLTDQDGAPDTGYGGARRADDYAGPRRDDDYGGTQRGDDYGRGVPGGFGGRGGGSGNGREFRAPRPERAGGERFERGAMRGELSG
jgi:hypothetical protein